MRKVLAVSTAVGWLALCALPAGALADGGSHGPGGHAAAETRSGVMQERWARMTPAQRRTELESASRDTRALNAALAGARDDTGFWEPQLRPLPEWAINAIVMPTGKTLIFGREPKAPGGTRPNIGSAQLFDPQTGATEHVPPPSITGPGGDPAPIFCTGQTLLSDGRVLLAGGNLADPDLPSSPYFAGLDYTFIFDPWTETWEVGPTMSHGRWYPSLVRLASGDVLIVGGLDEDGTNTNRNGYMDILRPGQDLAQPIQPLTPYPAGSRGDPGEHPPGETLPPDAALGVSLYPYLYTEPDGNVALAGPGQQDSAILSTGPGLYDRGAAPGSAWTQIGGTPFDPDPPASPSKIHQGGTGAIEPDMTAFAGSWNLLAMGGADDAGSGFHLARKTVDRLVAGPGAPAWDAHAAGHDPARDLNRARFYVNNVVLPDGGIVVVGGGVGADYRTPDSPGNYYVGEPAPPAGETIPDPPEELRQVELRRPGEQSWRLGAAQREWRTYHSTAWLLPDGRIVSAGDDGHPKAIASRDDAEFFWPPYLFDGDDCALRPVIRAVGATAPPAAGARQWASLGYGERFGIFSDHGQPGMQAVLVAPAATTHGVDMNQRLVPLEVDDTVVQGGVNVTMPANANIAPPGYYMLFVIGPDGTPSQARWVHVLQPADAAAERGGVALATVSDPWPRLRGRRCVNPDGSQRSEPDPPDTIAPAVSMTAPDGGVIVHGSAVTVAASASDNEDVSGVQFMLDGAPLGAEDTSAPYSIEWDSTSASNAAHTLTAVARDAAANSTTSAGVAVTVDNEAPVVSVTAPGADAALRGSAVQVSASASDNLGVESVRFELDGAPLGSADTSAPYAITWDTTAATNGPHTLTAIARDVATNSTTSSAVDVVVDNIAPVVAVSAPARDAFVGGTAVTVGAAASDNEGVAGVRFELDGVPLGAEDTSAPYAIAWDTTAASEGPHTLTAIARDAATNSTTSAPVNVTVDNVAPAVTVTAPAAGAAVSGPSVAVTAAAADEHGVEGVQFALDGVPLGDEDTSAPYAVEWDTTSASNGSHTLTAVARDAAANSRTSSAVAVTVANIASPPPPPGGGPLDRPVTPPFEPAPAVAVARTPAKLGLLRAAIDRRARELDVLAPITGLASGEVALELFAAGRRTRMSARVDALRRRVRVQRGIPAAQARLGTGILTMRYAGNAATRPQTVRLRAARRPARLVVRRPVLGGDGWLRASGTISRLARGVVRVQVQFEGVGGTRTLAFRAPIRAGRWRLDARLDRATRDAIAARRGTVHSYTLFTGYARARMRGEMRSLQVLGAP